MRRVRTALVGAVLAMAAAAPAVSDEAAERRNKQLVQRFYDEVWQKGNLDFADQVFAEDYVRHDPRGGAPPFPGPRGQKEIARSLRASFPDLRYNVQLVLADGDYVAARWTLSGTNTGPGPGGRPGTGKRVEFVGVNVFRFGPAGKVVEIWNHRDDLAMREQLGLLAPPGPPPSSVLPLPQSLPAPPPR